MVRSLLPEDIERYVSETMTRETPVQKRLREETSRLEQAGMQIGPDQGALFAFLVRLIGGKRCLEVGTFTGYSALAVAAALPRGGKVVTCDVSEEWTRIARRYWAEAGVADRVELRLGPAIETLGRLLQQGGSGSFDFAFIDADKLSYENYYEACLELVRPGGLLALDNMLWSGKVVAPAPEDLESRTLRALSLKIRDDDRVEACLLTIGDGLMLVRKRA